MSQLEDQSPENNIMRQLKDYSFEDNISYLRNEHKDIYDCLNEFVSRSAISFHYIQEIVDAHGEFEEFLSAMKSKVPQGISIKLKDPIRIINLKKAGNLKELANIFEVMLLDKLDRYDFSKLDPEIQELYLKAQKIIDKESQNDSEQKICS